MSRLQRESEGHPQRREGVLKRKILGCFINTLNFYHVTGTMLSAFHGFPLAFITVLQGILCYVVFPDEEIEVI